MRYPWYIQTFNIVNYTADCLAAWCAAHLVAEPTRPTRARRSSGRVAGVVASVVFVLDEPHPARGDDARRRAHAALEERLFTVESLSTDLVLAFLGVALATLWLVEPLADPRRGRAAHPHPPVAERARPRGGGARRLEDGALQRPPLRRGAARGARPRGALRPPDVGDHGRPRSPAGDQQHVRPPRGRRRAARHRRDVPRRPARLRRPLALRRRGVRDPAARDDPGGGVRDRRAHPPDGRRRPPSRSRPRASRSARRSRSASPAIPKDGTDVNELIHQADLAVYRAKLQGRNRALGASSEPLLVPADRTARLAVVPDARSSRSGPRRARSRRRRRRRTTRASEQPPRHMRGRSALPGALADPRRPRRARSRSPASPPGSLALRLLRLRRPRRPHRRRRRGRDRPGARARAGRRRLRLGERRRCARGRRACSARARRCRSRSRSRSCSGARCATRSTSRSSTSARSALASLSAAAIFSCGWMDDGAGRLVTAVVGPRRRRRVLRRQHRDGLGRDGARGPRQLAARLDGALLLAHAALRRLRRRRRRDRARLRGDRPLRPRGLRPAAPPHAQDDGGVHRPHAALEPQAPRGGRDDPLPERLARAGEPAAQGALDGGDGEPLGDRGRPRRLHRRPLAPRPAARARDRPRAGALAGRARPARPRGALPRHRQARHPRRDPPEAGHAHDGRVGAHAAPRGRGRAHHRPARVPERRRARRSGTTTSASTGSATRTASPGRRSRSARGSSTSRTRSTRC